MEEGEGERGVLTPWFVNWLNGPGHGIRFQNYYEMSEPQMNANNGS
jgi:hypothetical protein